jgi:hypothetical protein
MDHENGCGYTSRGIVCRYSVTHGYQVGITWQVDGHADKKAIFRSNKEGVWLGAHIPPAIWTAVPAEHSKAGHSHSLSFRLCVTVKRQVNHCL